jgi:ankyrin repeat protein
MIDNNNHDSIIKQIEDIIDTIYVDISHIYNFSKIINDNDNDNDLPISYIIKRKNIILNNKPISSINIPDNLPIHLIEFINIIIKNDADIHKHNEYVLRWVSMNGYLAIVECLIKHGADIHADNDCALQCASYNGHLDIVEYLIEHGANPNANVLRWASENNHLDVVECLIKNGAGLAAPRPDKVGDIHADNDNALIRAVSNNNLSIIECLIKNGADIHANNNNAIRCAYLRGHLDIVECLIKHGAVDIHYYRDRSAKKLNYN